jgi:superfamily II DNA or RNA helicase
MEINNGITIWKDEISDSDVEFIKNDLIVPNPKYVSAINRGRRPVIKVNGRYESIPKEVYFMREYPDRIEVPLAYADRLSGIIDINDDLIQPPSVNGKTTIQFRDYQQEAVDNLIQHNFGIICSPAASGKTIMGIGIVQLLQKKTLWIAHREGLVTQAIKTFEEYSNERAGFIGKGKIEVGRLFTGGIINTVEKYVNDLKSENFEVIFIDEVHRAPTSRVFNALNGLSPTVTYGLSATPFREDGLDDILYNLVGPIRCEIQRERLVKEGYIITPTIHIVETGLSILMDDMEYSDYITSMVSNVDRNMDILKILLVSAANNIKTFVLCDRTAHCDFLYDTLSKMINNVGVVHGKNKKMEKTIRSDVADGKFSIVITNYQYFSDGFDIPEIQMLLFVAPFSSAIRCEQTVGRVQRICQDKPDAYVIDLVDDNPISRSQLKNRLKVYEKLGCRYKFIRKDNLIW